MENAVVQSPPDWKELTQEDRAVFERVWRRVMPQLGPDSPIALEGAAHLGDDVPCILACPISAPGLRAPDSAPRADPARPGAPERQKNAAVGAPARQENDCAGAMERQVLSALELWQLYRALARRSGARAGQLSALAAQALGAARQVSAACFLRSGIRYWPAKALAAPRFPSWEGGLRMAYQRERQQAQSYRGWAKAAPDQAVSGLWEELADGCERRARAVWALLSRGGR